MIKLLSAVPYSESKSKEPEGSESTPSKPAIPPADSAATVATTSPSSAFFPAAQAELSAECKVNQIYPELPEDTAAATAASSTLQQMIAERKALIKQSRKNRRKASILADRIAKAEAKAQRKKTQVPPEERFCNVCKVGCNSMIVFKNHIDSKKHNNAVRNAMSSLYCSVCDRRFQCVQHLEAHNNSVAHRKKVLERRN